MSTPNALFAVFHVSNAPSVEENMQAIAPWLQLKIEDGVWVVVAPEGTTTKEVCEKVGIDKGKNSGIVVKVDSYFGVASPSIWEWIASKRGASLGVATSA